MSPKGRNFPQWVLPVGLVVLVVTLATVALVRDPASFDPDSPEGTVQEYLLAISEERWEDAIEIVHEEWRGACHPADLRSFVHEDFTAQLGDQTGGLGGSSGFDVTDGEPGVPVVPEDATLVEVTIEHRTSSGLGSDGWREVTAFELVEQDDFWWLVGDPWPYFVWSCRGSQ